MKQKSRVCDQSREIASLNPSFRFIGHTQTAIKTLDFINNNIP